MKTKFVKVEVPEWVSEELVWEYVRRLVEAEEARRRFVEDFERFREELWRKEGVKFFS